MSTMEVTAGKRSYTLEYLKSGLRKFGGGEAGKGFLER